MYSNTILKLDLIVIIIQKYCEKYLKPDKNIDKIKKSKTIQFVLDQLNDIRKTKDFKTLKSIFTIEKKHKIKDLKDWLNTLCANNFKLFSKHFKLDVEIDMTKGYRTYVNLLSKLGNNKTKVDLKESNKQISILFNLLFYDVIVGGEVKKRTQKTYTTNKAHRKRVAQLLKDREKTKKELKLYPFAKQVKTASSVVKSFQNSYDLFRTSVIDANKQKPKTILNIVALMEEALKATNSAQLGNNITCPPQQAKSGTCWINSVIALLVYSINCSRILEYICREEISKLPDDVLRGNGTIKTIILINFRLLFIFLKNDQIRTPIGNKTYTMPNAFIEQFVQQIFAKDPTFFKVKRPDTSKNPTSLQELLAMGGDYSDRQHLITNILDQGFGFTTDQNPIDPNTQVYNYKLTIQDHDYTFNLLHIPYVFYYAMQMVDAFKHEAQEQRNIATQIIEDATVDGVIDAEKQNAVDTANDTANAAHCKAELASYHAEKYKEYKEYKLASYILVAKHGNVRHSVAVVERNGENAHCNGWCDPEVGCMVQQIPGSTFSLTSGDHTFDFDINGDYTLALAYDNRLFVHISTIEEEFSKQLQLGAAEQILVESSSVNSSLSSLFDY